MRRELHLADWTEFGLLKVFRETKSFKMDASVQVDRHCRSSWILLEFAVENIYLSKVVGHKYLIYFFVLQVWLRVFYAGMSFSLF